MTLPSRITDSFLRAVASGVAKLRDQGAGITGEDMLGVLMSESGISNIQNRAGHPAYGLNQIYAIEKAGTWPALEAVGFAGTPQQYLSLSLAEQIPYVFRYFMNATQGRPSLLRDIGSLYLVNFTPAYISHANDPDWVISRAGSPIYDANRIIDSDGSGAIEIREMADFARRAQRANPTFWSELMKRYNEVNGADAPEEPPANPFLSSIAKPRPFGGVDIALGTLGLGIMGYSLWQWRKERR